jgi:hypothetical protein
MLCSGATTAAVVAAAVIATASSRAEAYPQYQLSRDQTCNSCHVSPAGGGLLSENGYSVAETLSQYGTAPEFFYNKVPLPSWLALGGDFRGAAGYIKTPDDAPALIPMQAEIYARAAYKGFSLFVGLGARPAQWVTGGLSPGIIDRFWSREHYVTWQADETSREGLFVRAGRFMPVFGLRLAEHPAYTRRYGGTQLYADTYGAAVEYVTQRWEGHVTGFVEDPLIDTVSHDSGVAAYGEFRIDPKTQVGAELMVTGANGHSKVRGGATGKLFLPAQDVLIQAELQVAHQAVSGSGAPTQIIGYAMGSKFLGSALLLDVGLGHYDENVSIKGLDRDALDVNLHWFITSHFELVWQNRIEVLGLGQSVGGPTGGWSLLHGHYRL